VRNCRDMKYRFGRGFVGNVAGVLVHRSFTRDIIVSDPDMRGDRRTGE
jgi:hypothetical protein